MKNGGMFVDFKIEVVDITCVPKRLKKKEIVRNKLSNRESNR